MIKKIRLLTVTFDAEIKAYEVPAFRGAIIDKVGQQHVLFHNHLNDGFRYQYPTIQYKAIRHQPAIVCIDEGVDEIHRYFQQPDWSLWLGDRKMDMKVANLFLNQFTLQVWATTFKYAIHNWIALSQENYQKYKSIEAETDRLAMLERILTANILAFAKGVGWTVEKPIELKIISSPVTRPVPLKGQKLLAFDLQFTTNVSLPNYIGLGKSVSIGYGMIRQIKDKEREN